MQSFETYELPCPDKTCGRMVDLVYVAYLVPEEDMDEEEELIFWEGKCPGCGRNLQLMGEVNRPVKMAQA